MNSPRQAFNRKPRSDYLFSYDCVKLDLGYRIDLLVENLVVVELKSIDAIAPVHQAQVLSYLKLSGKSLALLINFNVVHLKDGIRRFVNGTGWR